MNICWQIPSFSKGDSRESIHSLLDFVKRFPIPGYAGLAEAVEQEKRKAREALKS